MIILANMQRANKLPEVAWYCWWRAQCNIFPRISLGHTSVYLACCYITIVFKDIITITILVIIDVFLEFVKYWLCSCVIDRSCFNSGLTAARLREGFSRLSIYKLKSAWALHWQPYILFSVYGHSTTVSGQLASTFTPTTIKRVRCWGLDCDGWRTKDLQCSAIVRAKQALITARRTIDIITFQSAGPQWRWAAINWDEWSVDDNFHNRYTFRNSSR